MKYVETGIPAFRIEDSELLCMTLGPWAVSFEGYNYEWDNERTLGPKRGKKEFAGARLGLTEQCDFNCNDWFSPRYDFEEYDLYFDNSVGDYPFQPASNKYWERAGKYMLWEPWAWKTNRTIGDNWWSSKAQMEDSVWKQLTDQYRIKWPDTVNPLELIENGNLTREDLKLQTIHLYKEFDSEEEKNEAIKEYHINNLVKEIERIDAIPYGKGI